MRRNMTFCVGLSVAALLLGSMAASSAESAKNKERHTVLERLHHAHKLLTEADHDYDGHRAKAAEEVHKAIVELEGKHHAKPSTASTASGTTAAVKPSAPKQPAQHEPQASSDTQLKKALEILQEVEKEVGNGKHPKAATNVTKAIQEINTALSIK